MICVNHRDWLATVRRAPLTDQAFILGQRSSNQRLRCCPSQGTRRRVARGKHPLSGCAHDRIAIGTGTFGEDANARRKAAFDIRRDPLKCR